jgi:hypothetical protein
MHPNQFMRLVPSTSGELNHFPPIMIIKAYNSMYLFLQNLTNPGSSFTRCIDSQVRGDMGKTCPEGFASINPATKSETVEDRDLTKGHKPSGSSIYVDAVQIKPQRIKITTRISA